MRTLSNMGNSAYSSGGGTAVAGNGNVNISTQTVVTQSTVAPNPELVEDKWYDSVIDVDIKKAYNEANCELKNFLGIIVSSAPLFEDTDKKISALANPFHATTSALTWNGNQASSWKPDIPEFSRSRLVYHQLNFELMRHVMKHCVQSKNPENLCFRHYTAIEYALHGDLNKKRKEEKKK